MEHEAAGQGDPAFSSIFDLALPPAGNTEPTRAGATDDAGRSGTRRAPRARQEHSDEVLAARQRRQARHSLELSSLLNERAELRGVYAPADLVAEALSWSA